MYYSVIGMIAIVLHLIINHEFIKIDKNRDEVNSAFKRFVLASLMYYITDVLWGIFDSLKAPTLLYVVRENLIYGKEDASEEEIMEALNRVGADNILVVADGKIVERGNLEMY